MITPPAMLQMATWMPALRLSSGRGSDNEQFDWQSQPTILIALMTHRCVDDTIAAMTKPSNIIVTCHEAAASGDAHPVSSQRTSPPCVTPLSRRFPGLWRRDGRGAKEKGEAGCRQGRATGDRRGAHRPLPGAPDARRRPAGSCAAGTAFSARRSDCTPCHAASS